MKKSGKSTSSQLENEEEIKKDAKRFGFNSSSEYIRYCTKIYLQHIFNSSIF